MKRKHSPDPSSSSKSPSQSEDPSIICPICMDVLNDPYLTRCGHNMCHECLIKTSNCPICQESLKQGDAFPNKLCMIYICN